LIVGSLSGSGSISANGGNGNRPTGGGAGGGRIAIEIQNGGLSLSGPITAYGGSGPGTNWGGAGTIYLKQTGQQFGQIILDNAGHSGTNTPISNLPVSDLILRGAARGVLSASQTFHDLSVTDHAVLFCLTSGTSGFTVNVTGNAMVESGSAIDGNGLGYLYGGPGGGSNGNGAGHGGSGGLSASTGSGGGAYDLFSSPIMPGSAGNPYPYLPYYVVGAGGAVIRLNVSGSLILNGQISVNGTDSYLAPQSSISSIPYNTIGGGSGGSIWISAETLSGTGAISANGGNGLNNGGGGGGGRIAVSGGISGFAGTMSAHGGIGFNSGGAGTIYTKDDAKDGALLLVDNSGISGAGTPLPSLYFATDLAIAEGAMVTSTGSLTLHDLNIASNAWLQPASGSPILLTGSGIVNEGGGIVADGTGFPRGQGIGAGLPNPNGGGGGGHGGYGAVNTLNGLYGGNAYDSIQNPALAGSGGAPGNSFPPSTDGSGGGVIHLTAQQTLTVNGKISANGSDGDVNGGGGAGGSVWLSAGTFAGTGAISANGGSGGIAAANVNAPADVQGYGGGGGRIAIRCSSNLFAGNFSAHGGDGAGFGGAGTIFLDRIQDVGQPSPVPEIIVDNGGLSGTNTPVDATFDLPDLPFDLIVQNNAIVNFPTAPPVLNNLILNPGGIVSSLPVNANLDLAVVQNVIIASNSAIDLDGKGFALPFDVGPGAGTFKFGQGSGGAGYGGAGGMSASDVPGGTTYGSATRPVDRGSRGGASGSFGGSEGGGAVHLTVGGTLNVNGGILADGNPGTQEQSGGGSGGSIWISATSLEGTGAIQANGGAGELYDGGGGGGGRIAIYSPSNTFGGTISAAGAIGAFNGSDGTVFISTNLDLFNVLSQTPTGILSNTVSQVDLEFSSVLEASSVLSSDFVLGTPSGIETNLTISVLNPTTVRISFPEQTSSGDYSIQAGPQIEDFLGQSMPATYTGAFTILLPDITPTVTGGIQGTNLLMSWTMLSGITYQIYCSTNLTDWIPYGDPIIGDGSTVEMQLPINADPTKFFRVRANR
ncbi:MAG TPA: hypothetical protein VFM25_02205, partial [Verrucomicrobiae bacterium]|nr:hypothetical protein [Verrucomicrobiae bacterium]